MGKVLHFVEKLEEVAHTFEHWLVGLKQLSTINLCTNKQCNSQIHEIEMFIEKVVHTQHTQHTRPDKT